YLTGRENLLFSFLGMAPIEDPELVIFVSVQQPELEQSEYGSKPVSFIVKNVMENSLHYLNIEPDQEADPETSLERVQIPAHHNRKTEEVVNELNASGLNPTVVGSGEKIIQSN